MRRPLIGWAAALTVFAFTTPERASAQVLGGGVGADPFSFYYGYYLPHQAYIAAQPRPVDTLNQMTAIRQYSAQTDRAALYDPVSPYGDEDLDPLRPYSSTRERVARPQQFTAGGRISGASTNGTGPPLYYNRVARYYPDLRIGRGANRNVATTRAVSRFSGGGMGMPGMPSMPGVPGPR
jgi:hypothetical protein